MIYPQNIEAKIGFDQIRKLIREKCLSSLGASYVDNLRFSHQLRVLQKLLEQTDEFLKIIQSQTPYPESNYYDAVPLINKISIPGTFLDEDELYDLRRSLTTIINWQAFFRQHGGEFQRLNELSQVVTIDDHLVRHLDSKIDENGRIRDNASVLLSDIRHKIAKEEGRIRHVLERILKQVKRDDLVKEDAMLSIRDGRMVVPVPAENKRRVKGVVHDESATGQTVFIEPTEAVEINNEIRELRVAEKREIIRILIEVADHLRLHSDDLPKAYRFLGQMDFLRAKALFADQIDATLPVLQEQPTLNILDGVHPLLLLFHQSIDKPVVPLQVSLGNDDRILVISGPNAGGKSVALKTVALLQYMLQTGLLLPVNESSTFGLFKKMFVDIGDEQSIENDLSTYSSHLTNMKAFMKHADRRTLFCIDEFGTGTEPQFGGAIAEAILSYLNRKEAYGIVTTHYTNIKEMADNQAAIVNGAMSYDVEGMVPLYELKVGKPGSSFALEIAQSIGLPYDVLKAAKDKVGYSQIKFEKLLGQLEREKLSLKEEREEIKKKDRSLEKTLKDYTELKDFVDDERQRILNEAKQEARQILTTANRKVEQTIKEIKEHKAEKKHTQQVRSELKAYEKELVVFPEKPKQSKEKTTVEEGPVAVGDQVRIKGQEVVGEVTEIKGKRAQVLFGSISSKVALDSLEKVSKGAARKIKRQKQGKLGIDFNQRMANFNSTLDIRGKRAEEAVTLLAPVLDEALLLGQKELRIVHGKGDGILREVVRNYLREYPQVASIRDEHVDFGGSGVSLVELQ